MVVIAGRWSIAALMVLTPLVLVWLVLSGRSTFAMILAAFILPVFVQSGLQWRTLFVYCYVTGNIVALAAHTVAGDPAVFSYKLSVPVFMLVLLLIRLLMLVLLLIRLLASGLERSGLPALPPLLLLQLVFSRAFSGSALRRAYGVTPARYSRSALVC